MPTSKIQINNTLDFSVISKQRWILSLILGLLSSLALYAFFDVVRETYRVISLSFMYTYQPVSSFYVFADNLFFAFISLIIGNSITLALLFSKSQKVFAYRDSNRKRILNEQVFLNLCFMHWYLRFGIALGFFSLYYIDSEFPLEAFLFKILLIVVLYLESMKTLNRIIGKKRFKLLLAHFFILTLLSLFLSYFNVVNHEIHNKIAAPSTFNLPVSTIKDESSDFRYNVLLEIHNTNNEIEFKSENRKSFYLNDLHSFIINEKTSFRVEEIPRITPTFLINRDFPLLKLKKIELELFKNNTFRVNYVIKNPEVALDFYDYNYISKRINSSIENFQSDNIKENRISKDTTSIRPPYPAILIGNYKKRIGIKVLNNNYIVNGITLNTDDLLQLFKNNLNKETVFEYSYAKNTTYQDFITLYSLHLEAQRQKVNENRTIKENALAMEIEDSNYWIFDSKFKEEEKKLKNKFPVVIYEDSLD